MSQPEDVRLWRTADLSDYVGGLSNPGKMPGFAYSIPAAECNVGGKLRLVPGSTCSGCYALKGRYAFPVVTAAQYRRLATLDRPLWVPVMAELIRRKKCEWFRWHDAGDFQSVQHLANVCAVAAATADVRHWVPTREYRIVAEYVAAGGEIPANLSVRLSAHMIGGKVPTFPRLKGLVTVSTVSTSADQYPDAHSCPAPSQGNVCGDCRACWDPTVPHVDYHYH